jgi:ABC-2 type transport system permease protein
MGAIIEKEIRFLSRAPRFRMVFFMGFSFGLAIWLPLAFGAGPSRAQGSIAGNYLTFVTLYALMLLGEVSFWNTFGFDRAAAQAYFLMPAPFANVLMAKNIAAAVFVLLEITAVAAVCGLLGMPLSPAKLLESYSVSLIMTLYLISIGNLGSTYYPRPVSPSQTWRSATTGKFQAMLLLVYPVVAIPVALAYLARYAFDTQWAFYGMLALGGLFGGVIYWVSMESAVTHVNQQREQFLHTLSEGDGPIAA